MGTFFEKLWSLISSLRPLIIMYQYQSGVRMRFGKYTKTLEPGVHWRLPWVHGIIACNCKERIVDIPSQVINGTAIETTIRYEITDPAKALLEVDDYETSISNFTMGLIGERLLLDTEYEPTPSELRKEILEDLRLEAEGWGINVIDLKFATFAKARVFRLLGDS